MGFQRLGSWSCLDKDNPRVSKLELSVKQAFVTGMESPSKDGESQFSRSEQTRGTAQLLSTREASEKLECVRVGRFSRLAFAITHGRDNCPDELAGVF